MGELVGFDDYGTALPVTDNGNIHRKFINPLTTPPSTKDILRSLSHVFKIRKVDKEPGNVRFDCMHASKQTRRVEKSSDSMLLYVIREANTFTFDR